MKPELRIAIGITGGIAAYKIPALIRLLRKQQVAVRVVLTAYAKNLVGIDALRTVSENPVYGDDMALSVQGMDHISLADWADYFLVAPATANTIAKISSGIGDNLLTTLALSFHGPKLIIAPAMNTRMWENPATQENIARLRGRGNQILPVGEGSLACGTEGAGRMLDIDEIASVISSLAMPRPLKGRKVLISSGPTAEPIDTVRVITNRSSGRMGAALAQAALDLGATVTVVTGPAQIPPPPRTQTINVMTAIEMKEALEREFESADICILAAAVSDFRPETVLGTKMNREHESAPTLKLISNPDIAQHLGARKKSQFLVGFSLESSSDARERALTKMYKKHCDLMVLNHVGTSLEKETTEIVLLHHDGSSESLSCMPKPLAAREILNRIVQLLHLP